MIKLRIVRAGLFLAALLAILCHTCAQCLPTYSTGPAQALAYCQGYIPQVEATDGYAGEWACYLGNEVSYFIYNNRRAMSGPWCPSFAFPPTRPVPVVIDPGHGFNCAARGMPAGAVGLTDFSSSDPPPGRLQEDQLAMAISQQVRAQMSGTKYKIILTKESANDCPTYKLRGMIANKARARVFVSVHVNAPLVALGVAVPFANGSSAIYSSDKPGSADLANRLSKEVSSSLGVDNRGAGSNNTLAVLKATVTDADAVLLEVARLSGRDEQVLHSADSAARAAGGIKAALDAFTSQ